MWACTWRLDTCEITQIFFCPNGRFVAHMQLRWLWRARAHRQRRWSVRSAEAASGISALEARGGSLPGSANDVMRKEAESGPTFLVSYLWKSSELRHWTKAVNWATDMQLMWTLATSHDAALTQRQDSQIVLMWSLIDCMGACIHKILFLNKQSLKQRWILTKTSMRGP